MIFTKDWHPEKMETFASYHKDKNAFETVVLENGNTDTLWPDHCVAETNGAEINENLDFSLIKGDFYIFKKGLDVMGNHIYSGFGADGLIDFLKDKGVTETYVTGLATDFCVKSTAIDSVKNGFKTNLVWDATRGISEDLTDVLNELVENDVNVIDSEYFFENV